MPFWFSILELFLQYRRTEEDRRTKEDRMTEWQKMTKNDKMNKKGQKKTEWQKGQKRQNDKKDRIIKNGRTEWEGQKEIYYVNMILLWPRIDCNVEIYSNCATSCCTIELNSNVSYEIMKSMVLDTSNLLSFLRISILLSLLSLKSTR